MGIESTWHVVNTAGEPAFQGTWVNLDGGTASRATKFHKRGDGVVELAGVPANGVAGTVAFTLPAGYRPYFDGANARSWIVRANVVGVAGSIAITPNGDVTINQGGAGIWTFLDGITFRTF